MSALHPIVGKKLALVTADPSCRDAVFWWLFWWLLWLRRALPGHQETSADKPRRTGKRGYLLSAIWVKGPAVLASLGQPLTYINGCSTFVRFHFS
jgi:hypothetical protein